MLNPSTADENVFDPTVRRCFGYALTWGFSSMEVVNIFALRSTDPKALYAEPDPIGPRNDREILAAAKRAELVVAAWGTHGKHLDRGNTVANLLHTTNNTPPLVALKVTAAGHPGHPLYLPASIEPKPYKPINPQR